MMYLRIAAADDIAAIVALYPPLSQHQSQHDFVRRSIDNACCAVALQEDEIIGYGVLEPKNSFFGNAFISTLFIHHNHRRRGVGLALMNHLESLATTPKLFTSTNLSNLPMQRLLARLDYALSGVVHNMDEGDPELIYVKHMEAPQSIVDRI